MTGEERKQILKRFRSGRLKPGDMVDGCRVFFRHYRYDEAVPLPEPTPDGEEEDSRHLLKLYLRSGEDRSDWKPRTQGGKTECVIINGQETVAVGVSWCHPHKDNFCYKTGAHIALGRALLEFMEEQGVRG